VQITVTVMVLPGNEGDGLIFAFLEQVIRRVHVTPQQSWRLFAGKSQI